MGGDLRVAVTLVAQDAHRKDRRFKLPLRKSVF